jgi:hypothetical protein
MWIIGSRVYTEKTMQLKFAMSTRRRFLRDSSLAAAAALVPTGALAELIRSRTLSLDQVHFAAFAANVGTTFWVLQDQAPATGLELAQAQASPPPANAIQAAAPDAWNEKFSLLFRGLPSQPLEQDTYLFEHGNIGRFAMFIVPIGSPDAGYPIYQAIFNRQVGGAGPAGLMGRRPGARTAR